MTDELETAGAASVGGLTSRRKADLAGQPCRNCGEMVELRHCPRCGQLASSFHRPFLSLLAESVSDTLALDGRIARTLPLLLFRPGILTRRYNEGKRARYVPPFRLFLLSSLLFYLIGFAFVDSSNWLNSTLPNDIRMQGLSEEDAAALREGFRDGRMSGEELDALIERSRAAAEADGAEISLDFGGASEPGEDAPPADPATGEARQGTGEPAAAGADEAASDPVEERFEQIIDNPRLFLRSVESWTPRLSLLLVPFTMLALAAMNFWRRSVYVYDHAIHALHMHTWLYLAASLALLVGGAGAPDTAAAGFFLAVPVYVTFSMRGATGAGFIPSVFRMILLLFFWLIALLFLMIGILIASALTM